SPEVTEAASPESIRKTVIELIARVSAFALEDLKSEKRLGADLGFDSLVGADLFVALTERIPQTRTLSESLLRGDTTIEESVQAAHREVRIVSSQDALVVEQERALIDLTGLDSRDRAPNASDLTSSIVATLSRAAAVAAKAPLEAFVVAHHGLGGAGLAGIAK